MNYIHRKKGYKNTNLLLTSGVLKLTPTQVKEHFVEVKVELTQAFGLQILSR